MKLSCLFLMCGLLFLGIPTFSEISLEEFEKIRAIVKEEVGESEDRSKNHTTQEVAKLTVRMDETDKRRDTQFASVDRNFGYVFMLFVALLALIGLPLLRDWKKEREQDAKLAAQQKRLEAQEKRIEAQERELETIRKELTTLKQQTTLKAEQPQS